MIDLNHVNHQLSSIQDTSEFEHVGSMIPGVEKYGIVALQTSTSWRAIIGGLDMTQHYSPVILTCKWNMIIQEYIKKNKILYKQSILHFLHCYVTMSVYRNVPGIIHVLFILTLFLHPLPSSKDPSISARVLPYSFFGLWMCIHNMSWKHFFAAPNPSASVVFPHLHWARAIFKIFMLINGWSLASSR